MSVSEILNIGSAAAGVTSAYVVYFYQFAKKSLPISWGYTGICTMYSKVLNLVCVLSTKSTLQTKTCQTYGGMYIVYNIYSIVLSQLCRRKRAKTKGVCIQYTMYTVITV